MKNIKKTKLYKWINSKKGQEELKKSQDEAEKFVKELQKSRKVDNETLYRPFNI